MEHKIYFLMMIIFLVTVYKTPVKYIFFSFIQCNVNVHKGKKCGKETVAAFAVFQCIYVNVQKKFN